MQKTITVQIIIKAPIGKVWDFWNKPEHIVRWAFASDDWEAPAAENDLRVGGRFKTTMAAKDKSSSFHFTGTYTTVKEYELIEYDIDIMPKYDGDTPRHVAVRFEVAPEGVRITEIFDPEKINPLEVQRSGWQTILDNFKKYVELKK